MAIKLRKPTEDELRHDFQGYDINISLIEQLGKSFMMSDHTNLSYFTTQKKVIILDTCSLLSDRLANVVTPIFPSYDLYRYEEMPQEINEIVEKSKRKLFSFLEEICNGLESGGIISVDIISVFPDYLDLLQKAEEFLTTDKIEDVDKYYLIFKNKIKKLESKRTIIYEKKDKDAIKLIEILQK